MPSAFRPYFSSSATAGPDSPKQSCTPMVFTGVGAFLESVSHTAEPSLVLRTVDAVEEGEIHHGRQITVLF